jgi:uncharacterized membrane protein
MGPRYGFYSGSGMMNGGGIGLIVMLLFWAIFVAAVVLLVVWAVRMTSHHHTGPAAGSPPAGMGHDEAVAMVRRRFAAGEITKDQFDEMMKTLGT